MHMGSTLKRAKLQETILGLRKQIKKDENFIRASKFRDELNKVVKKIEKQDNVVVRGHKNCIKKICKQTNYYLLNCTLAQAKKFVEESSIAQLRKAFHELKLVECDMQYDGKFYGQNIKEEVMQLKYKVNLHCSTSKYAQAMNGHYYKTTIHHFGSINDELNVNVDNN